MTPLLRKEAHDTNFTPQWIRERSAGLLLHISSLPGDFGIGNLGKPARDLIDFLSEAGFGFWQICPVGPTGFGDSPYQTFSSFAGNPYFIDWSALVKIGLIDEQYLFPLRSYSEDSVDYGNLHEFFWPLAQNASDAFSQTPNVLDEVYGSYEIFQRDQAYWLHPYAQFQSLKFKNKHDPWWLWPEDERSHHLTKNNSQASELERSTMELHKFLQYVFFGQWHNLLDYARSKNISILGDLPLYVAPDCADLWQHPELFQLDITTGSPSAVAGVPPDYFNPDGQLWGNPLYDWTTHESEGYAWWLQRLAAQTRLFDVTRIDHFRGFHDYWSIPANSKDAKKGKWESGPGLPFFAAVREKFPDMPFLAEDLGLLSEGVRNLRRASGLPGMAILQFAFDGDPENLYLPHNLTSELVTYTGTHDNDTVLGWYDSAEEEIQGNFRSYLNVNGDAASWDMLRAAYRSVSQLCVIPMQDLLSLGSEARLNRPGEPFGNWTWRMNKAQFASLQGQTSAYLREQAKATGRLKEAFLKSVAKTDSVRQQP